MKTFYFEDENGTYFSPKKTRRFKKLTGKEAYDYLKEEAKKGIRHRFKKFKIELPIGDEDVHNTENYPEPIIEVAFVEVPQSYDESYRIDDHRKQYVIKCKNESGFETISYYAPISDHEDITVEETISDSSECLDNRAVHNLELETLRLAVRALSSEEFDIIHELYLSEQPISETQLSLKLGIPRTTLQSRKYQIFKKLRKFF